MYDARMAETFAVISRLPGTGAHYLLPFAARSRFLFKMDFAEAEYIARLRGGVKGHFSYRQVAWEMKRKMEQLEPELGRLMEATPPWVEDPLQRYGLQAILEKILHVAPAVENGDNLQGVRLRPVNDEVRVDRKKLHRLIRQILAPMAAAWPSRKISDLFAM